MLDVPSVVEHNEYAGEDPQLFPFHSRYVADEEWTAFISVTHCLFTLFSYCPQTLDALWVEKGISPTAIARNVLAATGSLLKFKKPQRRDVELSAAIPILETLTAKSGAIQTLLEAESCALLTT